MNFRISVIFNNCILSIQLLAKRVQLTCIFCFITVLLIGQQKGLVPIENSGDNPNSHKVRALIVGISDYQNIYDLQFAHQDALMFAQFLKSTLIDSSNDLKIKILVNAQATLAEVSKSLDELVEISQENDLIYIYFSGHGDVESRMISKPGYLLCYDAPVRTYMAGGALKLADLEEIINTLTLNNKSKVIVIMDACRSGKLAGASINGSGLMTKYFEREIEDPNSSLIKILACQSNENSHEGIQWGKGRGVFSYHLIKGLTGFADLNKDQYISVREINRYLTDLVPREMDPIHQNPKVLGLSENIVCHYIQSTFDSLKHSDEFELPFYSMTDSRKLEEEVLAKVDTNVQRIYLNFQRCIKQKKLLFPKDNCADYYYLKLITEPTMAKLYTTLTRNFAAILQDDAQQIINKILDINMVEITRNPIESKEIYQLIPDLLQRAAELLGERHYMYQVIKSRQFLFEGLINYLSYCNTTNSDTISQIINTFKHSLVFSSDNSLSSFYLANCYCRTNTNFRNKDSCYFYSMQAIKSAESWVLPYAYLGYYLAKNFSDTIASQDILEKGFLMDSSNVFLLKSLSNLYRTKGLYPQAIDVSKRAIAADPIDAVSWLNLGSLFQLINQNDSAEIFIKKSIELNPNQASAYNSLGFLYYNDKRFMESEDMYISALKYAPKDIKIRGRLCMIYLTQHKFDKVLEKCKEIDKFEPNNWRSFYYRSCVEAMNGNIDEAFLLLEQAVKNGLKDSVTLKESPFLKSIEMDNRFQKIVEKIN